MTVFYHGISFCISGYILLQLMNFKNLEFIFYLHGCIIGMKHQIKKTHTCFSIILWLLHYRLYKLLV